MTDAEADLLGGTIVPTRVSTSSGSPIPQLAPFQTHGQVVRENGSGTRFVYQHSLSSRELTDRTTQCASPFINDLLSPTAQVKAVGTKTNVCYLSLTGLDLADGQNAVEEVLSTEELPQDLPEAAEVVVEEVMEVVAGEVTVVVVTREEVGEVTVVVAAQEVGVVEVREVEGVATVVGVVEAREEVEVEVVTVVVVAQEVEAEEAMGAVVVEGSLEEGAVVVTEVEEERVAEEAMVVEVVEESLGEVVVVATGAGEIKGAEEATVVEVAEESQEEEVVVATEVGEGKGVEEAIVVEVVEESQEEEEVVDMVVAGEEESRVVVEEVVTGAGEARAAAEGEASLVEEDVVDTEEVGVEVNQEEVVVEESLEEGAAEESLEEEEAVVVTANETSLLVSRSHSPRPTSTRCTAPVTFTQCECHSKISIKMLIVVPSIPQVVENGRTNVSISPTIWSIALVKALIVQKSLTASRSDVMLVDASVSICIPRQYCQADSAVYTCQAGYTREGSSCVAPRQ